MNNVPYIMIQMRFIVLLVAMFAFTPVFAVQKDVPLRVLDSINSKFVVGEKSPVVHFGDTLFQIQGNIGSFLSKNRADAIQNKISKLAESTRFQPDSVKIVDNHFYVNIVYLNEILMSVDTIQAIYENKTKLETAEIYRTKLIGAIELELYSTSWEQIAMQIAGTLAIVLAEWFVFKFTYYLYRRLKVAIWLQRGKKIKGVFGIIDDQKAMLIVISAVRMFRWLLLIVSIYIGLTVLFTLFPYTKHISDQLLSYVFTPLRHVGINVKEYMPKLFMVIVIVFIFRYIQKFVRNIASRIASKKMTLKGFYPDWAYPTYYIISAVLFVFMFIFIFPYLPNSDSQVFQSVSVFAGIIISLGSTTLIGNLVAGLVITYMRPFTVGDRIKLGDFTGDVLEKTALVTRLKTPKNEVITIPNSNILSTQTVNYSESAKHYGLILHMTVGVGYDVPWQKVHEMLYEVASRTEYVLKRQKPFILQDQFRDFYVDYQLNVYIRDVKITAKIYSDLHQHAQDVFAENNIELVAPNFNVIRAAAEGTTKVPPQYVKQP